MRSREELDLEQSIFDVLERLISWLDPEALADLLVDGDLEPVTDDVRHIVDLTVREGHSAYDICQGVGRFETGIVG